MPLSAVVYTSNESFAFLKLLMRKKFEGLPIKPYTLSFAHKQEAGVVRVRATELAPDTLTPLLADMAAKGEAVLASAADRDVRRAAYGDLIGEADPSRRIVNVQYASPTIVALAGEGTPFPVVSAVFGRYREVWNAFSDVELPEADVEALRHVRVADFKISCDVTPFGTGAEGWVTLEMERGRTEREIALFNGLIDFAFYCGTGSFTEEGLGQTRKVPLSRPK